MDMPVNAEVHCADGLCGRSVCVIVNPVTRQITHLVVAEKDFPHTQRLVPVDLVTDSTPHLIHLRCVKADLATQKPFVETEYIQGNMAYSMYMADQYRMWPYVIPETLLPIEHIHIPPGELAVHRGVRVQATDGHVGQVDEFLVNPVNGYISHLILREGHLWGQKDVTIPVSQIARIEENTVYLKLDRRGIEALPAVPVHRRT
jgi:sporulation protein YlmC with PRC-barrel domain